MFKIYARLYQFFFKYKLRFLIFCFFLLGLSILESIQPYFYKLFVDYIPLKDMGLLFQVLIIYILVRVFKLFFDILAYIWGDKVVIPAARDIRLTVFKKIQDLDFAFHLEKSTGSLISAFKRGDLAVFNTWHILNIQVVRVIINFIIILFFFTRINWQISLSMCLIFGLNSILAFFLLKYNLKTRKEFNQAEDDVSAVIVDNLLNFETVKLFAKEDKEFKHLQKVFVPWVKKLWLHTNSFRLIDIVVGVIGNLSLLAVLILSLTLFARSSLSAGELIMIIGFISSFYYRFFDLVFEIRNLAKAYADLAKYFSVFDYETLVKDPAKPKKLSNIKGQINFENINFSYPEGKAGAVKDFNLKIKPGESVALVGESGAGKTTITKLLLRFYDPNTGQILLDKTNIKNLTKDNLRSLIGVVPQEPILFNNHIGFNIAYGQDNVSHQQIVAATKMANLHDFILTLPKGYQTQVGERGVKLSGGQKQRLAIARMILSNPKIIIFDEATSQLDSQSEKKIQDAFWKVAKNKTTLIIAHRLSSITKADRIIVMEDGLIKEEGTHTKLVANKNSLYNKFWQLQAKMPV